MKVCIRENYIDTTAYERFGGNEELLSQPPYNYQFVDCDKEDCRFEDFDYLNGVYSFSLEKYNARKEEERIQRELPQLKERLSELTKDLAQEHAGLIIPNIEEKKAEFRALLNQVREYEGKQPREIVGG